MLANKLHSRYLRLFLVPAFLVGTSSAFAQADLWDYVRERRAAPAVPEDAPQAKIQDKSEWKEVIEKRTRYRRYYKTDDGRIITENSIQPLNYTNPSGELVPIEPKMTLANGTLSAPDQDFPTYVLNDGVTAFTSERGDLIKYNAQCSIDGQTIGLNNVNYRESGGLVEGIHYKDVVPGVDKMLYFAMNMIETDYVVKQASNFGKPLEFSEMITLPAGMVLVRDESRGSTTGKGWQGELVVMDGGREQARFRTPYAYDGNGDYKLGVYLVEEQSPGSYKLTMRFDNAWLNAAQRAYPVVIDPLVTGASTIWQGGNIGSCDSPNYESDSIQITIPGQISITAIYCQGSYYADPIAGAVMGEGAMNFSTSCGQTQDMTVTGALANSPGTGYAALTDFSNNIGCCYEPQCTDRDIYISLNITRLGGAGGVGCNATYIYYNAATLWPFMAYAEGYTVEYQMSNWQMQPSTICSNQCDIEIDFSVKYGVPPYTLTHPWLAGSFVFGTPDPCSINLYFEDTILTLPNCPSTCGTSDTTLNVDAPTVVDACNNLVTGWNPKTITVEPAPDLTVNTNSLVVCSGDLVNVDAESCVGDANTNWTASSGESGPGDVNVNFINTGSTADTVTISIVSTGWGGCPSDTQEVVVAVNPYPTVDAGTAPANCIGFGQSVPLNGSGNASSYSWSPTSGLDDPSSLTPNAAPSSNTSYILTGTLGPCSNSDTVDICLQDILSVPNTFTPNGDGTNDTWEISNIHAYPASDLRVFTRWGQRVYHDVGYQNDWDGTHLGQALPAATYYYVLDLNESSIENEDDRVHTGSITIVY